MIDNDIVYAMNKMNGSSKCGLHSFNPILIKNIRCHIMYTLKVISSKSMDTGFIPDDWKNAMIIPVYKNNMKPSEVALYRRICLTSNISKLLRE